MGRAATATKRARRDFPFHQDAAIKLRLKNFRNYADLHLALIRKTLIVGPNAAGKSSVAAAIATAIIGRNRWTDRGGRGLAAQIKEGADEATVRIEGLGEISLTRTIGRNGSTLAVDGFMGNTATQSRALLDRLGASERIAALALDVERFLDLPPKEQTALLFEVTGREITYEDLLRHFARHGLPAEAAGRFVPGEPRPITAEDLDSFYKAAFQSRAQAKKTLADIEALMKAAASSRGATVDPKKEPEYRARIADLEKKETELRQELVRAREAERIRAQIAKMGAETKDADKKAATIERRIDSIKTQIAAIDAEEPTDLAFDCDKPPSLKCPALGRLVPCVADPKRYAEAFKAAQKATAGREARTEERMRRRSALVAEIQRLNAEEATLRGKIALEENRKNLEECLETLGNPREEAEIAADLDDLRARISKGRDLLVSIEASKMAANVEAGAIDAARKEVETLEKIVTALGPENRGALMADKARAVFAEVEKSVREITGGEYAVSISLSPDLSIRVSREGRFDSQPAEALSASERVRVDLVLRDAIASMARFPILLLDAAEALDVDNLRLVLKYLDNRAAKSAYALLLVIGTSAQPIGGHAWNQVFLEEGKALPVPA